MKIIITTTFEHVDNEYFEWYLKRLEDAKVPIDISKLRQERVASFASKDPTGPVVATTEYQIRGVPGGDDEKA